MSGEKAGADIFVKDKELAWVPARLLSQTADKAQISVASYSDEFDIDLGGKGASKWTDQTVNLKDYAEYGKQLPLQNTQVIDDMVDLPYLHEVCLRSWSFDFFDQSHFSHLSCEDNFSRCDCSFSALDLVSTISYYSHHV